MTADEVVQLSQPGEEMKVCSFLWSYYGYPTSTYEGKNVEVMRYRNGQILANNDAKSGKDYAIDYVSARRTGTTV